MSSTERDPARTVAWFDRLEDVRAAEVALERHGIEPTNVVVRGVDTVQDRGSADRRAFGWLGRRVAVGAVIGAVIGAAVGAGLGALLGYSGSDLVAFVLAGTVFGIAPGFFYTAGSRLPARSEVFDTFADESPFDHAIEVLGPPETLERAELVLASLDPVRIDRAA